MFTAEDGSSILVSTDGEYTTLVAKMTSFEGIGESEWVFPAGIIYRGGPGVGGFDLSDGLLQSGWFLLLADENSLVGPRGGVGGAPSAVAVGRSLPHGGWANAATDCWWHRNGLLFCR